jgi:hypothetical protein
VAVAQGLVARKGDHTVTVSLSVHIPSLAVKAIIACAPLTGIRVKCECSANARIRSNVYIPWGATRDRFQAPASVLVELPLMLHSFKHSVQKKMNNLYKGMLNI